MIIINRECENLAQRLYSIFLHSFSKGASPIHDYEANGAAVQLCQMGIKKTVPVFAGTVSLLYEKTDTKRCRLRSPTKKNYFFLV